MYNTLAEVEEMFDTLDRGPANVIAQNLFLEQSVVAGPCVDRNYFQHEQTFLVHFGHGCATYYGQPPSSFTLTHGTTSNWTQRSQR